VTVRTLLDELSAVKPEKDTVYRSSAQSFDNASL
jgi:hypothetical protein